MGLKRTANLIYHVLSARPPRILYVGGWQGHQNLGDERMFVITDFKNESILSLFPIKTLDGRYAFVHKLLMLSV